MFNWFGGKSKTALPEKPTESSPNSVSRLKEALSLTGKSLFGQLFNFSGSTTLDEETLDSLEESLLRADVGLNTTTQIIDKLRAKKSQFQTNEAIMDFLKQEFTQILTPHQAANQLNYQAGKINIYLVVGVNGAGKTTFIGKLANRFRQQGKKVVIGAGDTFRAAAEDQLAIWAERSQVELVRRDGADPASVIYDAIHHAKETQADVVILDTAGRLQNKFNLMEELKKINRVIQNELSENTCLEALLVLDATTGQNALRQAEVFKETVQISGVILTKLDSSAKGGVILTIAQEYNLPVKMIGVGEGIDDLKDFNATEFIEALFNRG